MKAALGVTVGARIPLESPGESRPAVTGVILAGGRGSRMGEIDKGLQLLQGKPLVQWVLERLAPQVDGLVVSANRNIERYREFGVATVSDRFPDFAGPLAGLQAAMSDTAHPLLACVPCDAPLLPLDLVARLRAGLLQADADLAVARGASRRQPVFCLCRCDLLPQLTDFLERGGRKVDAWQATLRVVEVGFDDAPEGFTNINSRDDLARFQA
jgi:molybdopterin-guanine dinucleotide biosynthesis protein A